MRAADFLAENDAQPVPGTDSIEDHEGLRQHVIQFIQERCRPWLQSSGRQVAYRGTRAPYGAAAFVKPVRRDRRPSESSADMHQLLDGWIDMVGGVANRSNSAFVTSRRDVAMGYGDRSYVVMPVGEFRYTWSPQLDDWFIRLGQNLRVGRQWTLMDAGKLLQLAQSTDAGQRALEMYNIKTQQDLRDLLDTSKGVLFGMDTKIWREKLDPSMYDPAKLREWIWVDRDLDQALNKGHEIMIHAGSMLYLKPEFFEEIKNEIG